MQKMMMTYDSDPKEYARLAGFGYRMLAEAIKADLPYRISCPALLICGEKDKAGSAKSYNKKWHQREGLTIKWIKNAGHNSNADQPDEVNRRFLSFNQSFVTKIRSISISSPCRFYFVLYCFIRFSFPYQSS